MHTHLLVYYRFGSTSFVISTTQMNTPYTYNVVCSIYSPWPASHVCDSESLFRWEDKECDYNDLYTNSL